MSENGENGARERPKERVLGRDEPRPAIRRFYKDVGVEAGPAGVSVLLDGRPVRTPLKRALAVANPNLAMAMAREWGAQGETVEPASMPLTRIANSAIDGVADDMESVRADIVAFAGNDLVCYRATEPAGLAARQSKAWDPVVAWAATTLDAHFRVVSGVMPVRQPQAALEAVAGRIEDFNPLALAALHVITTLTGSALLALLLANRGMADAVWDAAHVDEDYQIEHWGRDAEAEARRRFRRQEFDAAATILKFTLPDQRL